MNKETIEVAELLPTKVPVTSDEVAIVPTETVMVDPAIAKVYAALDLQVAKLDALTRYATFVFRSGQYPDSYNVHPMDENGIKNKKQIRKKKTIAKMAMAFQKGMSIGIPLASCLDALMATDKGSFQVYGEWGMWCIKKHPHYKLIKFRKEGTVDKSATPDHATKSNLVWYADIWMAGMDLKDDPITMEYSIKEAMTAGIINRPMYKKYPERMVLWKLVSYVRKIHFPGSTGDMEIVEDMVGVEVEKDGLPIIDITPASGEDRTAVKELVKLNAPKKEDDFAALEEKIVNIREGYQGNSYDSTTQHLVVKGIESLQMAQANLSRKEALKFPKEKEKEDAAQPNTESQAPPPSKTKATPLKQLRNVAKEYKAYFSPSQLELLQAGNKEDAPVLLGKAKTWKIACDKMLGELGALTSVPKRIAHINSNEDTRFYLEVPAILSLIS